MREPSISKLLIGRPRFRIRAIDPNLLRRFARRGSF